MYWKMILFYQNCISAFCSSQKTIFVLFLSILIYSNIYAMEKERIWIYFIDKGNYQTSEIESEAKKHLSQKSIDRRAKKNTPIGYDFTDIPISQFYVKQLEKSGIKIIHKSKWFNGVSAYVKKSDIPKIEGFPFVEKIEKVKSFKINIKKEETSFSNYKSTQFDYGPSFNQNDMIGVPAFHSRGYSGAGIRIALFDTGFKTTHEAFRSVNIVGSRDFIEGDNDVSGYPGDTHGSLVLGVIAGNSSGNLIGPAYDAEYLLAKTDIYISDSQVDEDNWVAAAEWADSLGADIISSSVGYNIYYPGEGGYTVDDMNGNTAIVTKAADLAVRKGITVFATAGNEGGNSWNIVLAPADGDSVIAVGAVNSEGIVVSSSSRGPTADGRIKPDLVAQGSLVYTVSTSNDSAYIYRYGTSMSTPLAAGAGALVLSAMPSLSPRELYHLLIRNASNYEFPNNNIGYGIINIEPILGIINSDQNSPIMVSPNPFQDFVKIDITEPNQNKVYIYNSLGQKIKTFAKSDITYTWYGESDKNNNVSSGVYFVVLIQDKSLHVKKIVFIK